MRYFWTGVATLLASLGYVFGFQAGFVWTLIVATGIGVWSLYHRIRPGVDALDRLNWRQLLFIVIGATVIGLVLRASLFGSAGLLSMLI